MRPRSPSRVARLQSTRRSNVSPSMSTTMCAVSRYKRLALGAQLAAVAAADRRPGAGDGVGRGAGAARGSRGRREDRRSAFARAAAPGSSLRRTAPPPVAITAAPCSISSASVAASRSRNAASPSRANSAAIVAPLRRSISLSQSTKSQPSCRASFLADGGLATAGHADQGNGQCNASTGSCRDR